MSLRSEPALGERFPERVLDKRAISLMYNHASGGREVARETRE